MLLGTLTGTVYGNVQGNQLSLLWSFASSFTTPVLEKEDLSSSDPSSEGDVGETAPTVVDTEFSNFLQGTPSYTSESTLFGGNICRGTGEEIDLPETTSL
ncbi:MAG: hypothetical protein LBG59_00970 [Candidatus Peribacteria bacterium]|jgi:hypothetical protein|nr:hypothetical protein [Candidatus Peribacteria bacterium]